MFLTFFWFTFIGDFSPTPPYLATTWLYYLTMEPVRSMMPKIGFVLSRTGFLRFV